MSDHVPRRWKSNDIDYLNDMTTPRQNLTFSIQTADERREAEDRRAETVSRIQHETGIDDTMIDTLVETFYERVRDDDLIGPVFSARITDWAPHLAQMKLFWSSVALHSGVYQGRPMPKHLPLPIDARHFDRWMEIFEQTVNDVTNPVAAQHFMVRARRIAQSLELGIANKAGVLLDEGQRFTRPAEAWTPDT